MAGCPQPGGKDRMTFGVRESSVYRTVGKPRCSTRDARANRGGRIRHHPPPPPPLLYHRPMWRGAGDGSRMEEVAAIGTEQLCDHVALWTSPIGGRRLDGRGDRQQVLAHIREVDAIAQWCDARESDGNLHVAGKIDPASDIGRDKHGTRAGDPASVERAYQKREGGQGADKDDVK